MSRCPKCGYKSCVCGVRFKTDEEIEEMLRTPAVPADQRPAREARETVRAALDAAAAAIVARRGPISLTAQGHTLGVQEGLDQAAVIVRCLAIDLALDALEADRAARPPRDVQGGWLAVRIPTPREGAAPMKTPSEFAEERTPLYDGPCPVGHHELTEWIKERDAEHAASSSVAWEALERVSDMLQGAENPYDFNSGHWHLWNDRRKRELSVARAALALRPGGKP